MSLVAACDRLRDRCQLSLLAFSALRVGEELGLRHNGIDAAVRLVGQPVDIIGDGFLADGEWVKQNWRAQKWHRLTAAVVYLYKSHPQASPA